MRVYLHRNELLVIYFQIYVLINRGNAIHKAIKLPTHTLCAFTFIYTECFIVNGDEDMLYFHFNNMKKLLKSYIYTYFILNVCFGYYTHPVILYTPLDIRTPLLFQHIL